MKQKNPPSPLEIILGDYINECLPVTKESASKLAYYFRTTSELWLELQRNYDESKKYITGGSDKVQIILDRQIYTVSRFFEAGQLKRLCGCDNNSYSIAMIVPEPKPDLTLKNNVLIDGLHQMHIQKVRILQFFSYKNTPLIEGGNNENK